MSGGITAAIILAILFLYEIQSELGRIRKIMEGKK